jgi:hypothetical protein
MNRTYPIVVFNPSIDDSDFTQSQAIDLFYQKNNKDIGRLLELTEEDFSSPYLIRILDIISNYTNYMPLEISEDGMICDQETKMKCLKDLHRQLGYYSVIEKFIFPLDNFCCKWFPFTRWFLTDKYKYPIRDIFYFAIKNNKNIYFMF